MNNRVNYIWIGVLVLVGITSMIFFGFWMLKPTKESETQKYIIYFQESVLGLNIDAPVKYKGFNVGKVINLSISKNNSEQVEVLVEISKQTPVNSSTVAQLTSQGITGLSYINLTLKDEAYAKELIAQEGETYPVIRSVPSLLIKIENRFIGISEAWMHTLEKMQLLLNTQNQRNFSLLLQKSAALFEKMDRMLDEATIVHVQESIKNIRTTTRQIDAMMPKLVALIEKSKKWEDDTAASFASIMKSYKAIESSMSTFKSLVQSGDLNIKEMTSDVVENINTTLLEMQKFLVESQETINKYKRSPADMLFMHEEIKKGPGEE